MNWGIDLGYRLTDINDTENEKVEMTNRNEKTRRTEGSFKVFLNVIFRKFLHININMPHIK